MKIAISVQQTIFSNLPTLDKVRTETAFQACNQEINQKVSPENIRLSTLFGKSSNFTEKLDYTHLISYKPIHKGNSEHKQFVPAIVLPLEHQLLPTNITEKKQASQLKVCYIESSPSTWKELIDCYEEYYEIDLVWQFLSLLHAPKTTQESSIDSFDRIKKLWKLLNNLSIEQKTDLGNQIHLFLSALDLFYLCTINYTSHSSNLPRITLTKADNETLYHQYYQILQRNSTRANNKLALATCAHLLSSPNNLDGSVIIQACLNSGSSSIKDVLYGLKSAPIFLYHIYPSKISIDSALIEDYFQILTKIQGQYKQALLNLEGLTDIHLLPHLTIDPPTISFTHIILPATSIEIIQPCLQPLHKNTTAIQTELQLLLLWLIESKARVECSASISNTTDQCQSHLDPQHSESTPLSKILNEKELAKAIQDITISQPTLLLEYINLIKSIRLGIAFINELYVPFIEEREKTPSNTINPSKYYQSLMLEEPCHSKQLLTLHKFTFKCYTQLEKKIETPSTYLFTELSHGCISRLKRIEVLQKKEKRSQKANNARIIVNLPPPPSKTTPAYKKSACYSHYKIRQPSSNIASDPYPPLTFINPSELFINGSAITLQKNE